jgi:hypothetical protein
MAKKKLEKLKKEKKAIKIIAESSKPTSKWVEKDSHVQHITARPKTIVNQRERRPNL